MSLEFCHLFINYALRKQGSEKDKSDIQVIQLSSQKTLINHMMFFVTKSGHKTSKHQPENHFQPVPDYIGIGFFLHYPIGVCLQLNSHGTKSLHCGLMLIYVDLFRGGGGSVIIFYKCQENLNEYYTNAFYLKTKSLIYSDYGICAFKNEQRFYISYKQ